MSCVTEDRYLEAVSLYEGWCTECNEFTRDSTEPDAEKYDCPVCGDNTVMGAEQAILLGVIDFGE